MNQSDHCRLAQFILSRPGFVIYTKIDGNYGHIGAALADAVLQSNNHYARSVRPRIARIRERYAAHRDLRALQILLKAISVHDFLNWQGKRRAKTFQDLIDLLDRDEVNTEQDLRQWLEQEDSRTKLLSIKFIGPKTVDYLKILVGLPCAAMDRHLNTFLENAGCRNLSYEMAQDLVHRTARLMNINPAHLDHSIWRYMSGDTTPVPCGA